MNVRRRDSCRLCGGTALDRVLSLPPTPPANAFVPAPVAQDLHPQDVFRCTSCGHVQLGHVVDAETLFGEYVYASGTSPVFVKHFDDYAQAVVTRFGVKPGDRVVEIGSNDGVLLRAFKARGAAVLGVDPARKIAAAASASGVETRAEFFTEDLARALRAEGGPAKVITANNCMAHIDDLAGVVRGVAALLADYGVFVMEVQYLVELVRQGLWDMVYAEHVSYHHVGPLIPFFARAGLGVFDVQAVPTHGGSIRVFVRRAAPFLERADWDGREGAWTSREAFARLQARIGEQTRGLKQVLADLKRRGGDGLVAGYGVPAKATTLMYTMGLSRADIDYCVDDSPWKIGLLSPGLHVPVLAPTALLERRPRAIVIFAWNFADSIAEKIRAMFAAAGGEAPPIVVPLPEPRIMAVPGPAGVPA